MKKTFICSALIFAVCVPVLSHAKFMQLTPLQCPARVMIKQEIVAAQLDQWSSVPVVRPAMLNGWTIYEGAMGDTRYAQAPTELERHGKVVQVWDVHGQGGQARHKHRQFASNFWISCNYSDTAAVLQRPIPAHIKQCHSTLHMDKHHNAKAGAMLVCE